MESIFGKMLDKIVLGLSKSGKGTESLVKQSVEIDGNRTMPSETTDTIPLESLPDWAKHAIASKGKQYSQVYRDENILQINDKGTFFNGKKVS